MDGPVTTQEILRERVSSELPGMAPAAAEELVRLLERLVDALRPERIHIFGSQARGDATTGSDVDLLVVVPDTTQPSHRLAQRAYHAMGKRTLPVDVIVMSSAEFERRSRALASLPATVIREGKTLYAA